MKLDAQTILVVEDDSPSLHVITRQLGHLGYVVLWARDTADALQLLENYRGRVDLMILDVVLPGVSVAPAFVEDAISRHPELRVLYVSAFDVRGVQARGVDPERDPFLAKPFSGDSLRDKIQEILSGTDTGSAEVPAG